MVTIYGLIDPETRDIFYIGQSKNMQQRIGGHLRDSADTPKTRKIKEILSRGGKIEYIILSRATEEQAFRTEYSWIHLARSRNWPLTNTSAMKTDKYSMVTEQVNALVVINFWSREFLKAILKSPYVALLAGAMQLPALGYLVGIAVLDWTHGTHLHIAAGIVQMISLVYIIYRSSNPQSFFPDA